MPPRLMPKRTQMNKEWQYVTQDMVDCMENNSEAAFAQRVLDVNDKRGQIELITQVRTGEHIIDFLVRNLKRGGSEKFVEVTIFTKSQLKNYHPPRSAKHHKGESLSLFRKHGQIKEMQQSGKPWTILTKETIDRLEAINKKHPDYQQRK
jgi:hypothetical protein